MYSAILGIVAYLDVPIVYFSVEIWQGNLHPDTDTKMNLHPTMIKTWILTWLAMTLLYGFILALRYQAEQLRSRLSELQYRQMGR